MTLPAQLQQRVDDDVAETLAVDEVDKEAVFHEEFKEGGNPHAVARAPFVRWMGNLPKNVSVGMLDAGLAAAEFVEDVTELAAPEGGGTPGSATPKRGNPVVLGDEPLSQVDLGVFEAIKGFRDHLAEGSTTADQITQGVAQFAIPFAGWARAFGGISRAHTAARNLLTAAGAETATSAVNLLPDTGRFADLLELGQHAEGKLGDAMRAVAPDDSIINQYINWMNEREDEGPWAGRFKNTVDSLATSGAVAGLVKGAASTFKKGRQIFNEFSGKPTNLSRNPVFEDQAKATYERVTDALLERVRGLQEEAGGQAKAVNHPINMADVVADLDRAVPANDPFRIVVDKLKKQDLKGKLRFLSNKEYVEKAGTTSTGKSFTRQFAENDEILINLDKTVKAGKGRGREAIGYSTMHELVHAGTVRNMRRSKDLLAELKEFSDQTKEAVPDSPAYGYTNAFEFVAEAFSNMKFQNAMKKAGTWEPFVKKIGTIFGLSGAALVPLDSLIQQQQETRASA